MPPDRPRGKQRPSSAPNPTNRSPKNGNPGRGKNPARGGFGKPGTGKPGLNDRNSPSDRNNKDVKNQNNRNQRISNPKTPNLGESFHQTAARIVRLCLDQRGSPKSLVLSGFPKWTEGRRKRLYAVVCEAIKRRGVVESVVEKAGIDWEAEGVERELGMVLVHELLFGKEGEAALKGRLGGIVLAHKDRLRAEFSALDEVEDAGPSEDSHPRYVRVNTLLATQQEILASFAEEGYNVTFWTPSDGPFPGNAIVPDTLIPNLLALPPNTPLHSHPLLESGKIIIQDKSSCFPAAALDPPKGGVVLDCCAAPGNKTTHAAALVGLKGKVIAVERDTRRAAILKSMVLRAGAKNVRVMQGDFLQLDTASVNPTHILLDPSCSGSGISDRTTEADDARLEKLAEFQKSALKHAMGFPSAQRISYSTCSIHAIENERVVLSALEHSRAEGLGWELVKVLPDWHRRGLQIDGLDGEEAARMVRVEREDGMGGFFVAVFERSSASG